MGIFIFFVLLAELPDSLKDCRGEVFLTSPLPNADRWIGRDKFHHFSYSLGITGLSYHIYHCQFNNPDPEARYFSISLTAVAGISKELYDKFYKKSRFSYKDLVWDAVGITVGSLLFLR